MCLRSMCLPNDICSSVRRMCSVSTMSLSHASGWLRLALSLLGILDLIPWNRCNICVCSFWNVELRMALHTRSICLETWDKVNQLIVVHWVKQGSSLPILRSLKEPGSITEPIILWSLPWDLFISPTSLARIVPVNLRQLGLWNKRLSQSSILNHTKNDPNKKWENNNYL